MAFCNIYIPSYHRPKKLNTVRTLAKLGYPMNLVTVFIDSEADDREAYDETCAKYGCNLHVFDMEEARRRYDYVHRPSESRRSAGQARNMFQDYAKSKGVDFYCVSDDDSSSYQIRVLGRKNYRGMALLDDFSYMIAETENMMRKRHIGCFGWSQTGDFICPTNSLIYRGKVMNTTFYLLPYVYRGERGVQDDDTSMFVGMFNQGLFTGSYGCGIVLLQKQSAQQAGGLTDLYHECKLLNKALVTPIQFPSAIYAEKQKKNGGRLHHKIMPRYLRPCLLRGEPERDNIAWDKWAEDWPFTNEPNRGQQ